MSDPIYYYLIQRLIGLVGFSSVFKHEYHASRHRNPRATHASNQPTLTNTQNTVLNVPIDYLACSDATTLQCTTC